MVAETATNLSLGTKLSALDLDNARCIVFIRDRTASMVGPLVPSFNMWIYICKHLKNI